MLSRFPQPGVQALARSLLVKFQSTSAKSTSEVPAQSGKRDLVNFPRRTMKEFAPKVRFAILPDSWFQFLYPKTGVTGPYMLLFGGGTYLFSKEIIVVDHNLSNGVAMIGAIAFLTYKFGDKIGISYNKYIDELEQLLDEPLHVEKESSKQGIKHCERLLSFKGVNAEIAKAKVENVKLQLEAAYRERLLESQKKVKNRLDCMVELDNITRRITQKNLMDYVLRNVTASITPELENSALQSCIDNLNSLSARA